MFNKAYSLWTVNFLSCLLPNKTFCSTFISFIFSVLRVDHIDSAQHWKTKVKSKHVRSHHLPFWNICHPSNCWPLFFTVVYKFVRRSICRWETNVGNLHTTRLQTDNKYFRLERNTNLLYKNYLFPSTNLSTLRPLRCGDCFVAHPPTHLHDH